MTNVTNPIFLDHNTNKRYCKFCAWVALTPTSRVYCGVEVRTRPVIHGVTFMSDHNMICTRVPGHDGEHVACTSVDHEMAAWGNIIAAAFGLSVSKGDHQ